MSWPYKSSSAFSQLTLQFSSIHFGQTYLKLLVGMASLVSTGFTVIQDEAFFYVEVFQDGSGDP